MKIRPWSELRERMLRKKKLGGEELNKQPDSDDPDEGTLEEYACYEQYLYGYKAHKANHKMLTFSGWVREERKWQLEEED